MIKKYSREEIYKNLREIGLERGDILLIKIDPISIGVVSDDPKTGFLNTLLDFLGPGGTLVAPSFTKSYFLPFLDKNKKVFKASTTPNTGAFSKQLLKHPNSLRSSHPTNSFVALGKSALRIVEKHNHKSHSYYPLEEMINLNAKALMVGCLESSPGHLTAHLAQFNLDQSTKNLFKYLTGATYYDGNKLKVFLRKDIGGHAFGASKFYKFYEQQNAIRYGMIGNAQAGLSYMKDSYLIEKELLKEDPRFILCDDPLCFSCRATWRYNKKSIPGYVLRKSIFGLKKMFGK